MREICTSGSVRGEGGNILTYSALLFKTAPLLFSEPAYGAVHEMVDYPLRPCLEPVCEFP
jgi:hypothetical protein